MNSFKEMVNVKQINESDELSSEVEDQLQEIIDEIMSDVNDGKETVGTLQDGVWELIYNMDSLYELEDYVSDTIKNHGMDMGFEDEDEMEENLESWQVIEDNIEMVWAYIDFLNGDSGKIVKVLEGAIKRLP